MVNTKVKCFFTCFPTKFQHVIKLLVQWRPFIIIADNVINRLLLSKSVIPKHSIQNKLKIGPFIIINLSVIVIKLQIILVHI
jgi:hypothetical protein